MRRGLSVSLSALISLLLLTPSLYASGFSLFEQGARAMGQANAVVARPYDPSAVFYNPAGLTRVEGFQLYVGGLGIFPNSEVDQFGVVPPEAIDQDVNILGAGNLYVSYNFGEIGLGKLAVGFGATTPFGLKTEWPEDFPGRFISTEARLRDLVLEGAIAWEPIEELAIAGTAGVLLSDVLLKNAIPVAALLGVPLPDAQADLDSDIATEVVFGGGILFRPHEKIAIGGSYKSQITVDYDGEVTFTNVPAPLAPILRDGAVTAEIGHPWTINAGIAFTNLGEWDFEFDLNWQGYSNHDVIPITFEDNPFLGTQTLVRGYRDEFIYRVGAEWHYSDMWTFRFGGYRDTSPAPNVSVDPILPDADRTGGTLGVGIKVPNSNVTIDASYLFVAFKNRNGLLSLDPRTGNERFDGLYKTNAHLFAVNFGYRFF